MANGSNFRRLSVSGAPRERDGGTRFSRWDGTDRTASVFAARGHGMGWLPQWASRATTPCAHMGGVAFHTVAASRGAQKRTAFRTHGLDAGARECSYCAQRAQRSPVLEGCGLYAGAGGGVSTLLQCTNSPILPCWANFPFSFSASLFSPKSGGCIPGCIPRNSSKDASRGCQNLLSKS
jgi:hypothetical protein